MNFIFNQNVSTTTQTTVRGWRQAIEAGWSKLAPESVTVTAINPGTQREELVLQIKDTVQGTATVNCLPTDHPDRIEKQVHEAFGKMMQR